MLGADVTVYLLVMVMVVLAAALAFSVLLPAKYRDKIPGAAWLVPLGAFVAGTLTFFLYAVLRRPGRSGDTVPRPVERTMKPRERGKVEARIGDNLAKLDAAEKAAKAPAPPREEGRILTREELDKATADALEAVKRAKARRSDR